jgi:hypothetical protein
MEFTGRQRRWWTYSIKHTIETAFEVKDTYNTIEFTSEEILYKEK